MKRDPRFFLILLLAAVSLSSCLKKDFDRPADKSGYDPKLPVTHAIAELLSLNGQYDPSTGGDTTMIPAGVRIEGIVTGDDRSGNLFKRIAVDDGTAAVTVLIDMYNLYNDYPVGRKVYINCGGLYLGYDGGLPVIGAVATEKMELRGIDPATVNDHIVKGNVGNPVVSDTLDLITAKGASPALYSRLVTIRDVQFSDITQRYTQPNATTNRDIMDCDNNTLVVRSSNYANFATSRVPSGKGYITGIYTVYISANGTPTPQLVIRDTNDVRMEGPRCNESGSSSALISIDSLRKMYTGSGTMVLGSYSIKGIVISDRNYKNTDSRNLVIQDGDRGITIRFSASHSFNPGDEVLVDVKGAQLGEYNGLLEAGAVSSGGTFPASRAVRQSSGNTLTPAVLTIAQVTGANFEDYESTLVRIMQATIAGGSGTYSGNKPLTDASNTSGSFKLYTVTAATFSGAAVPSHPVNITGIVGQFNNTKQLTIRNTTDVE